MQNLVVVGGGISGLSLAYFLRRAAPASVNIKILEANNRLGGLIQTTKHEHEFLFEDGPRGFRPSLNGSEILHLVEELGLKNQCIRSVGNDRFIFTNGKIQVYQLKALKIIFYFEFVNQNVRKYHQPYQIFLRGR